MATLHRDFVLDTQLSNINLIVDEVRGLLQKSLFLEQEDILTLILREALANAMKHGNLLDPRKKVYLSVHITHEEITFTVRDEGSGFDPGSLHNPVDGTNVSLPSGRGIFIIRQFADRLEFNRKGNEVTITILRPR